MDLRTLTTFVKVAEECSFARAAKTLGMTPSGVSNAIARLERRIGVALLARTTRTVALTEDGHTFYERCRHALREIEEAELALSNTRTTPQGRLSLDLPFTFGRVKIIPLLPGFFEKFPRIKVDVSLNDRSGDHLDENVDVALRFGPIKDSRLIARQLTRLSMCICASPDYLAVHGRPRVPSDLGGHACIPFLVPGTGSTGEWRLKGERGSDNARFNFGANDRRLSFDNADALVRAACVGLGLIQVVRYLVDGEIADGVLETVLDGYALPGMPLWIIYRQSRQPAPKIRAFVDYIRRHYA